uniref:C-type lectin domain-containing protein n=1 Tax=Steinernema glaseri TaxID=37863 RepID=A0A1I7ZR44_9BILA
MRPILLLSALVGLIYAEGSCPRGAIQSTDGTKCYQFLSNQQQFSQAQETCLDLGGNLASVTDGYENNRIAEQANALFKGKNLTQFWVGGNDLAAKGTWRWTDGTGFGYSNWASGQPQSGGGYDCLMVDQATGLWQAFNCFGKAPFVCEVPVQHPATCPPPPTCPTLSCPTAAPCVQKKCHAYCPSTWSYFEQTMSCYKVFHGMKFWDAESNCVAQDAHLASIHSEDENAFVADISTAHMTMANYHQTWIGAYTPEHNYNFNWTDGTPMNYKHWAHAQPDHKGRENCVMLLSDDSVWLGENHWYEEWDNVDCDYEMRGYVCKKPAIVDN